MVRMALTVPMVRWGRAALVAGARLGRLSRGSGRRRRMGPCLAVVAPPGFRVEAVVEAVAQPIGRRPPAIRTNSGLRVVAVVLALVVVRAADLEAQVALRSPSSLPLPTTLNQRLSSTEFVEVQVATVGWAVSVALADRGGAVDSAANPPLGPVPKVEREGGRWERWSRRCGGGGCGGPSIGFFGFGLTSTPTTNIFDYENSVDTSGSGVGRVETPQQPARSVKMVSMAFPSTVCCCSRARQSALARLGSRATSTTCACRC